MKFNYFIDTQLIALNEQYKTLNTQQKRNGASYFDKVLRPPYENYLKSTQSTSGFFKSYIPCTAQYKIRSDCAQELETARNTIMVLKS